jgi:hypothetical protein
MYLTLHIVNTFSILSPLEITSLESPKVYQKLERPLLIPSWPPFLASAHSITAVEALTVTRG